MEVHTVLEKIRKFRELKGLSREEMASELALSISGYGKLERGEVELSIQRLIEISDVLDIEPSELMNTQAVNVYNFSNNTIDNSSVGVSNISGKEEALLNYIKTLRKS